MRLREYVRSRPKAVFFAVATLTIGSALGVAAATAVQLHSGAWPEASIKEALAACDSSVAANVVGISFDTTGSTPVFTDKNDPGIAC